MSLEVWLFDKSGQRQKVERLNGSWSLMTLHILCPHFLLAWEVTRKSYCLAMDYLCSVGNGLLLILSCHII